MGTVPQEAIAPIPPEALVGDRAYASRAPIDMPSGLAHAAPPPCGRRHRAHDGVPARTRSRPCPRRRRPGRCLVGNRSLRRQPPVLGLSRARPLSLRPGRGAQRSLHGGRHLRRVPDRHDRNVVIPRGHTSRRLTAPDGTAARHLLADRGPARPSPPSRRSRTGATAPGVRPERDHRRLGRRGAAARQQDSPTSRVPSQRRRLRRQQATARPPTAQVDSS